MALTDSIVAYWTLDESSGSRADSAGSNTLTDNNSVSSGTGIINSAGSFARASSKYLSISDNAALSMGDIDCTFTAWVKLQTKPSAFMDVLGKHNGATIVGSDYLLYWDWTSDRFGLTVYQGASNTGTATANNFGAPATGTWYFIAAWHDSVNNLVGISVNAGTANTTTYSSGINDTTEAFRMGANALGSYWDGLIDEVGVWKRKLSSGDITSLYNGGAGLAYPFSGGSPLRLNSTALYNEHRGRPRPFAPGIAR